ncbi:hypothetical protein MWN33_10835 [Starkeya koreensis]|uniref:Uncharacterized protein n=1 Tax=Ancylobacter koreensis TaxID=266121 RepID=A0ABT0DMM0_9HYPH|nr:hypothetical protein [Ancylobacter koreensis]MCK0208526.1 hypothetical protein [Ancylobacter koreensis]
MKILVVTPHAEYERRAGARIRYGRLREPLQRLGVELALQPVAGFADADRLDADVYLLSKCHDPAALVLAQAARMRGRRVGIDLFDDYFSQMNDPRFAHLRAWLAAATRLADFVLCSTPAMCEIARLYAPHLPVHVLNDPFDRFDAAGLEARLAAKSARLRSSGRLQIAWFGIGDNPHFPVGLRDLAAFGDRLADLQGRGLDVHLRVLTNRSAATVDVLAGLRHLPVPYTLHEWGEGEERALLDESYAAFLPVNAQPFSVAKSLNRAVTALCAGAQALSAGYPLYEPLAPFVYREAGELVDDARAGTARLRDASLADLAVRLDEIANPEREAQGLVGLIGSLSPGAGKAPDSRTSGEPPCAALVHGLHTSELSHDLARRYGVLSVGTPFAPAGDYDLTFQINAAGNGLDLLVHRRVARLVAPAAGRLVRAGRRGYLREERDDTATTPGIALARLPLPSAQASAHRLLLSYIVAELDRLLPGVALIVTDAGPAPAMSALTSFTSAA